MKMPFSFNPNLARPQQTPAEINVSPVDRKKKYEKKFIDWSDGRACNQLGKQAATSNRTTTRKICAIVKRERKATVADF